MFGARYFGQRWFGGRYFGHVGLTSPGVYWGGRYFGRTYFGPTYFGSQSDANPFIATVDTGLSIVPTVAFGSISAIWTTPFVATVTAGLAVTPTVSFNATAVVVEGEEFLMSMPLELSITPAVTFSGVTVQLAYASTDGRYFGGRYFGARYYGPSYWGTQVDFEATVTAGLAITPTVTFAATVNQILVANISNTLALTPTVAFPSASTTYTTPSPAVEGGGYWPDYGRPRRKKRKPEEAEDALEVVKPPLSLPKRPLKLDALLGPDKPAVAKETPEQIEARIKKAAEERKKRKRRKLEDDLLLM